MPATDLPCPAPDRNPARAAHAAAVRRLRYPCPHLRPCRPFSLCGRAHLHAAGFDAGRLPAPARRARDRPRGAGAAERLRHRQSRAARCVVAAEARAARRRRGRAGHHHRPGPRARTMRASAACASISSTTRASGMSFRSTWCGRWRTRSRRSAGTSNSWSISTTRRSLRRRSPGCRWTSWSGISAIRATAWGRGRMPRASMPSCGCSRPAAAGSSSPGPIASRRRPTCRIRTWCTWRDD